MLFRAFLITSAITSITLVEGAVIYFTKDNATQQKNITKSEKQVTKK